MAKSDSKNINIEVAFPLPDIQVWQRFMVGLQIHLERADKLDVFLTF